MEDNGIIRKLRGLRRISEQLENASQTEADRHEWREVEGVLDLVIRELSRPGSIQA